MIKYRTVKTDKDKVICKSFCEKNKFHFRPDAIYTIAIDTEKDEIVGICGVIKITQIQPLKADNPLIAHTLSEKAVSIASLYDSEIQTTIKTDNLKWKDELKKYGFTVVDENMSVLVKEC